MARRSIERDGERGFEPAISSDLLLTAGEPFALSLWPRSLVPQSFLRWGRKAPSKRTIASIIAS